MIDLNNKIILAPMAGVTDFAFRSLCRELGADLSCTEMISAEALCRDSKKTQSLLIREKNETPCIVQIFGKDPSIMAKACSLLQDFDIIDINMGCPAPKIIKNGEGSALMKNFALSSEIVKACVAVSKKPITVKMRLGFDKDVAVEFAKMLEEAGASAITVHGRLASQGYSGQADYDAISKVVKTVKIPVIANGDICDINSLKNAKQTGSASVMVGRASLGNPEIFSLLKGQHPKICKIEIIKKHILLLSKVYSQKYLCTYMRKHLLWYCKNFKNANALKLKICQTNNLAEAVEQIEEFIKTNDVSF